MLAAIESSEEQKVVEDNAPNGAWIGLSDVIEEGTFTWLSGAPLTYTNWGEGQPSGGRNEDCVWISDQNGKWEVKGCFSRRPYVCQRDFD